MKNEERERSAMSTNDELTRLMKEHDLSVQQIADVLQVKYDGVINWLRTGSRKQPMPKVALLALRLSIELKRI
jgi:hypothetical protein